MIVNINASPFHLGKSRAREQMLATRARENGVVLTYTNIVGGQDELVFDGNSVILDHRGEVIARGKAFEEDLIVADLKMEAVVRERRTQGRKKVLPKQVAAAVEMCSASLPAISKTRVRAVPDMVAVLDPLEEVYLALTLGVRDYVRKNGFARAVIGLSGGVDSALTAVLAVDALGVLLLQPLQLRRGRPLLGGSPAGPIPSLPCGSPQRPAACLWRRGPGSYPSDGPSASRPAGPSPPRAAEKRNPHHRRVTMTRAPSGSAAP